MKVQQAIDTIIFFKNKPRTFEKQHCENGQNVAHIRYQFGSNIKCDIENTELSPRKIVILQSVYCWLEMWKTYGKFFSLCFLSCRFDKSWPKIKLFQARVGP